MESLKNLAAMMSDLQRVGSHLSQISHIVRNHNGATINIHDAAMPMLHRQMENLIINYQNMIKSWPTHCKKICNYSIDTQGNVVRFCKECGHTCAISTGDMPVLLTQIYGVSYDFATSGVEESKSLIDEEDDNGESKLHNAAHNIITQMMEVIPEKYLCMNNKRIISCVNDVRRWLQKIKNDGFELGLKYPNNTYYRVPIDHQARLLCNRMVEYLRNHYLVKTRDKIDNITFRKLINICRDIYRSTHELGLEEGRAKANGDVVVLTREEYNRLTKANWRFIQRSCNK
jgi:hypothetical protein